MENKKANEKLEKLTIRISKNKKEMLKKMVEKSSYNSISELARAGIDKELNIEMYKENLDFIIKALDQMLDEKLKPFIASQRKLNAKYLRTSVINTYLQGEVMNKLLGDNMHKDFIKMCIIYTNRIIFLIDYLFIQSSIFYCKFVTNKRP